MKLILNQGLDVLRFGMIRSEVIKIYGKPSKEKIDSDNEDLLIWEYADKNISLTFYKNEAGRLGYIRSSNPNLSLNQSMIIGCQIELAMNLIDPETSSWDIDEYDLFSTYFHEGHWLTLNAEFDKVTHIELGVPFKNENEYDWPK